MYELQTVNDREGGDAVQLREAGEQERSPCRHPGGDPQVEVDGVDHAGSGLQQREVRGVVRHGDEGLARLVDALQQVALAGVLVPFQQQMRPRQNAVHRRTDLVHQHAQQLVLDTRLRAGRLEIFREPPQAGFDIAALIMMRMVRRSRRG